MPDIAIAFLFGCALGFAEYLVGAVGAMASGDSGAMEGWLTLERSEQHRPASTIAVLILIGAITAAWLCFLGYELIKLVGH